MTNTLRPRRLTAALAVTAAAALALTACGSSGGDSGGGGSKNIDLVGFSTPKPAYDALAKGFQATSAGKGVQFSTSYDASGSQSKSVANGKAADFVAFSTTPDMTRLVPQFVNKGWDSGTSKGIGADSVVVIAVRPGNPKKITGWDDLIKNNIGIVTADPASSGSAKWNILAAYTHILAEGGSADDAKAYLASFFKHVVSKATSGSNAAKTFLAGTGDVLISYESEAITARQAGEKLDYIVPKQTFLIQTPIAVTKSAPQSSKDFLKYVESDAGQKLFASAGWRPVDSNVDPGTVKGANSTTDPFPKPDKLMTVADLGGWDKVNSEFFDEDNGLVTKIEGSS